jgi:hypothetical protein
MDAISSSVASASPLRFLISAQRAVEYTKKKIPLGASNRLGDVWDSRGESITCVGGEKVAEMVMSKVLARMDLLDKIRTIAKMAEDRRCGNCAEQACVAFAYLYDQGVRPLDLMQFANGDHGMVVIGRSEVSMDSSKWGAECYVADPWLNKWYAGAILNVFWPSMRPVLIYRAK